MDDAILNVLMGETVVHRNPLATVTRNCLVMRDEIHHTQAVIGIQNIRQIRKVNTTNTNLLAIAVGFFTIAAAAYASHERNEAVAVSGAIGMIFVLTYFSTRRASVLFVLDDQQIESRRGSYREATSIIRAVEQVNKFGL